MYVYVYICDVYLYITLYIYIYIHFFLSTIGLDLSIAGWVKSQEQSTFSYNHIFWYYLYLCQWFKLNKQ